MPAARVLDQKKISQVRAALSKSKDILALRNVSSVRDDKESSLHTGAKCILLKPPIDATGT